MRAGPYWLWSTQSSGYVHLGRIIGQITANRTNLGQQSLGVLPSGLAQQGDYLRVVFGKSDAMARRPPATRPGSFPSFVSTETDDLQSGTVAATVRLDQPEVAVLSASFDPRWTATVDGHPQSTEMVAPALVGTPVSAGTHRIVFRYRGFRDYPILFALSSLTLAGLMDAQLLRRRRRASARIPKPSASSKHPPARAFSSPGKAGVSSRRSIPLLVIVLCATDFGRGRR
jgi:hypothetical protein